MPVFSVEGNIGSGKSTLLTKLKTACPNAVIFIPEPVDEWNTIMDSNGVTILENYYKNQTKWAFAFQMMAFITRVKQFRDISKDVTVIMERSVFTDRNIFAKMLFDSGKINDIEYAIYLKWFDELVGNLTVDGVIYVNTTPEVCEQRIQKRARLGEAPIEFEYLAKCDQYHGEWLRDHPNKLVLNGDKWSPEEMVQPALTFVLIQSAQYFFSPA